MQATPKRTRAERAPIDDYRLRLVHGLSAAVAEKGYAAATIGDIVRHAGVSRRTFYEHFRDKEGCYLAAYELASTMALETVIAAAEPEAHWRDQIAAAVKSYLLALESQPALTRSFLLEIHAAGPQAMAQRRVIHDRFAQALRGLVTRARRRTPELRPLSAALALALVGGIHELVLSSLERGHSDRLRLGELEESAVEFVSRLLAAH